MVPHSHPAGKRVPRLSGSYMQADRFGAIPHICRLWTLCADTGFVLRQRGLALELFTGKG